MESASVGATYSVHYDFSISDFSLRIVVSVFRLKSYKSIFENCYLLSVICQTVKAKNVTSSVGVPSITCSNAF